MLRRVTPLRPKAKRKSAAVKRHHDRVARQGCCVCGGEATVHHVTGYADKMGRFSRDDWLVAPLCPAHHQIQHGPHQSVEALGHRGFFQEWGIDLLAVAEMLREDSLREQSRAA